MYVKNVALRHMEIMGNFLMADREVKVRKRVYIFCVTKFFE